MVDALAQGRVGAREWLDVCLARIEATDGRVNAFTDRTFAAPAPRPTRSMPAASGASPCHRWPVCRTR